MEKTIQSKCLKYLKANGFYAVKVITANKAGVPDIIACKNGVFFAFEIKSPNKKATPLQLYNLGLIQSAGGQAFIVDDVKVLEHIISLTDLTK